MYYDPMENQYLALAQSILRNGEMMPQRAKIDGGTKSIKTKGIFGAQLKCALVDGFPLLTTKKMSLEPIKKELLWFLSGSTNNNDLKAMGCNIWNEWTDDNGHLGPVYGHAWRNFGGKLDRMCKPKPQIRDGVEPSYCGVANSTGSSDHPLKKTWQGLIGRCYDPKHAAYKNYGEKGVHVCDRWLEFTAFAEDAVKLPGWDLKEEDRTYCLDKDELGNGFVYSPETCQWISRSQNERLKSTREFTVEKIETGETFTFSNPYVFCAEHGIDNRPFSDLWSKEWCRVRYGFRLVSVKDAAKGVDQISNLLFNIQRVVRNPEDSVGRRMILTAWNPGEVDPNCKAPLGCHTMSQYSVRGFETGDLRLDCHMYQRSADLFLGVPYNIACYALFTEMLAKVSGIRAGDYTHSFGDVHIYENHIPQMEEQIGRRAHTTPWLIWKNDEVLTKDLKGIPVDFVHLEQYKHHSALKGEVAV